MEKHKFNKLVDWKYSNARNYAGDETVLKIDNQGTILGML